MSEIFSDCIWEGIVMEKQVALVDGTKKEELLLLLLIHIKSDNLKADNLL
jgi:hypothetical protein